jgi:hypothetical protein
MNNEELLNLNTTLEREDLDVSSVLELGIMERGFCDMLVQFALSEG